MIARKGKMENNIYKRQATEALQILSKIENLSYVYNPLSDYIHYSERDLTEAKDKLSRRNMQIKELKKRIESLIVSYETHCPEAKDKSIAIKLAKEVINH